MSGPHPAGGTPPTRPRPSRTAHYEPSPYWNDPTWTPIVRELHDHSYQTRTSRRLTPHASAGDAHADWHALTGATCSSPTSPARKHPPEQPPRSAPVAPSEAASSCTTVPAWTFAHGREPNWRNLMIQHAVDSQFADVPALRCPLAP